MPIRMRRCITASIVLTLIVVFVVGCGQKGDLYLPGSSSARYSNL